MVKTRANYNILLGRRWLLDYIIVPSTLLRCFKYIDGDTEVHMVFADKRPFKGNEIYFTFAAMYEEKEEKPLSTDKCRSKITFVEKRQI